MSIPIKYRELQRMSATELLELLGDQIGVVYVDSQPKLRIISFAVKPPHDDSQAKPNVATAPITPSHDDSQRKRMFIKGRGWVEVDADNNAMPEDF